MRDALSSGDLSSLAPPDGEGRRVLDEVAALQRQLTDDLLPQAASEAQTLLTDPARLASEVQRAAAEAPGLAQDAASAAPGAVTALSSLLRDPAKAAGLLQREALNAVSRTPEGLEMARYTVLPSREASSSAAGLEDAFELREYEPMVCCCHLSAF